MKIIGLVILMAGIWFVLDTPMRRRRKQSQVQITRISSKNKTISFTELAFMRKDLTTARSLVRMGLVQYKFGGATETTLRNFFHSNSAKTETEQKILRKFGLVPESPNFVGEHPQDPERKITN